MVESVRKWIVEFARRHWWAPVVPLVVAIALFLAYPQTATNEGKPVRTTYPSWAVVLVLAGAALVVVAILAYREWLEHS